MVPSQTRKKTFLLPQDKLAEVQAFLKSRSETEAVIFSLEEVLWRKKLKKFLSRRPGQDFKLSHKDLARIRQE